MSEPTSPQLDDYYYQHYIEPYTLKMVKDVQREVCKNCPIFPCKRLSHGIFMFLHHQQKEKELYN